MAMFIGELAADWKAASVRQKPCRILLSHTLPQSRTFSYHHLPLPQLIFTLPQHLTTHKDGPSNPSARSISLVSKTTRASDATSARKPHVILQSHWSSVRMDILEVVAAGQLWKSAGVVACVTIR